MIIAIVARILVRFVVAVNQHCNGFSVFMKQFTVAKPINSLTHQKLRAQKFCRIFEKGRNDPEASSNLSENHTIKFTI